MITLKSAPGTYYSAQGDLLFVLSSDNVDQPDFKYIADIYIGGVQQVRLKRIPQPDNTFGVFNIGDVIRNYLLTQFNPVPLAIQAQQLGAGQFFIDVQIKFGEEYGGTLYTNLLTDITREYYNHYNGRMFGVNTILPPVLDRAATSRAYESGVGKASNASFIPYLPSTNAPFDIIITKYGTTPTTPFTNIQWGYFATDPTTGVDGRTMQFNNNFAFNTNGYSLNFTIAGDQQYLVVKEDISQPVKSTWFNTNFNYGVVPDQVFKTPIIIGSFRYYISRIPVVLDSNTYVISFGNATPAPPAPVTGTSITVTITPSGANVMQILNLSPGAINNNTPNFIDDGVEYYTVQLGANSVYRYDVICEPRYEKFNIHFLNKYGGFDTKLFSKVSRKVINIAKKGYGKLSYKIDGYGVPQYFTNNVYNDISPIYTSQYTEQIALNSDFVNDAEYIWLQDLMVSPIVYIEINGYYIPIDIAERSFEVRKTINDKLTNITITAVLGGTYSAQQR